MLGGGKHRFAKKRSSRVRHTRGRSTRGRHTRGRSTRGRNTKGRHTRGRNTKGRHTRGRNTKGRHTRVRRKSKQFGAFGNHSYTSKGGAAAEGAKALPYIDPKTGTIITRENLNHFNRATGKIKNPKAYRKFIEEQEGITPSINNEKVKQNFYRQKEQEALIKALIKANRNEGERLIKEEEEEEERTCKEFLELRGYIVTKIVETPMGPRGQNPRRNINTRRLSKVDEEALEKLRKLKDEEIISIEDFIILVHQYFRYKNLN